MLIIPDWPGRYILYLVFYICLIYTLYISCKNSTDRLTVIGIMALGFLSQLVMGLSPTLYESSLRTFVYASFAIIVCALYLFENGAKAYVGTFTKIILIIACVASFSLTFAIGFIRMMI